MAVTGKHYGLMVKNVFSKKIDWVNDSIKVALLNDTYVPDQDTQEFFSDVVASEITGTGYTAGGMALANKSLTYDGATNTTKLDADDVVWANATLSARYAVFYDAQSGVNSTNPLIAYFDFGENLTSTNYDFKVTLATTGLTTGSII